MYYVLSVLKDIGKAGILFTGAPDQVRENEMHNYV